MKAKPETEPSQEISEAIAADLHRPADSHLDALKRLGGIGRGEVANEE